jgi:TolB-like protein/DNA-binding winged helix-turn-helix (wHTH) protein/Flp pilus assembly protein TadD
MIEPKGIIREFLILISAFLLKFNSRVWSFLLYILCTFPMHTLPSERVRFGAFELDLSTGELRSTETPEPDNLAPNKVLLREQVLTVLRMLVEREGKIVTREEIKNGLWANDTIVDFDQSINATIKALRRALGDSADNPRYIETLGRRGYRLALPIEYLETLPGTASEKDREQRAQSVAETSEDTARVQRQMKPHWWKAAVALASVVILAGAGFMSWRHFRSTVPPRKIMLAVLPFENLTGDPNKEYLADGLTEETISQLGRLNPEQLGVIARTSVMGYKHKGERLDQIGRDLSVQYVLENSLRESGDHLRLTAQLIQVKDQTHLWSQNFDYPAKDVLKVEDDVAKAVAREIRVRLTSQQKAELGQSHPVTPEAFDAYMQGHYYFERDTDRDTDMAAKYFERATQLDPSYALAWVGLSRARKWQAVTGLIPKEEGYRVAREEVERALALNPNLAQAHTQMGRIKEQIDFDWTGADASYRRAVELEPGDPESIRTAGISAAILGRFDEALQLQHRAVDLDPLDAHSWAGLGELELFGGKLVEAEADLKKARDLRPDDFSSSMFLSELYVMEGRPQDALPEIERVGYDPIRVFLYAITYHALGRKKESDAGLRELIAKYQAINPYLIAEAYAFQSQPDQAFKWLDRAYAEHDDGLIQTKLDPLLKNLHGDPRFAALLKKLNLPT